jgi:hypothetical protein
MAIAFGRAIMTTDVTAKAQSGKAPQPEPKEAARGKKETGKSQSEKAPEPESREPARGQQTPSPARVIMVGADLRGVNFQDVNLEHADLRASDISGVSFSGRNLRYIDLRGATAHGTSFQGASLYGAKMQGLEAFGADFRNSDMRQANLGGIYLEGAMMPPLERRASPGEIADGGEQREQDWQERLAERRMKGQEGSGGNDQSDQARGRSLPQEQKEQKRGRGR